MNHEGPTHPIPPTSPGRRGHRRAVRQWAEQIGLVAPRDAQDRWAHRRGEPRGFAVLWMVFLLISTVFVFLTMGDPVRVTGEGYREGIRTLITVIALGITVLWPMLRLSQASAIGGGIVVVAKDLVILLIPLQAVIWPQALITGWSFSSVAASAIVLVAWALIVGALLAVALGTGRRVRADERPLEGATHRGSGLERTYWMLSILALVFAGPVLMLGLRAVSGTSEDDLARLLRMSSPLTAPWELLRDRIWTGQHAVIDGAHWRMVWMTLCLAVMGWILVAIWRTTRRGGVATGPRSA